jgi:F0F1-type ATP synthase assembly protein I
MSPEQPNPIFKDLAMLSVVTTEVVVLTGLGLGLGWWLTEKHGFPSWTLAVTTVLGLAVAVYRIYVRGRQAGKDA